MTGLIRLIEFIGAVVAVLVLGMVTSYIDRKVTARVQARIGPPWYQPAADILKLLGKETLVPDESARMAFLLAPVAAFAGAAVAAYLLVSAIIHPDGGFVGDVVVLVYLLMIPAAAMIFGAGASGNPMAAVGAAREIKMMLAYELPYLLVVATVVYKARLAFRLDAIMSSQVGGWFLWSLSGLLGLIVLILSMQAKLGLVPFDQPEAEQELMGGILTEYSGPPLALIKVAKMMLLAILPLFIIMLLMGGIRLEFWSLFWGLVKYLVLVTVVILVRNTNPRLRIDHTLKFFWGPVTVMALAALVLTFAGW